MRQWLLLRGEYVVRRPLIWLPPDQSVRITYSDNRLEIMHAPLLRRRNDGSVEGATVVAWLLDGQPNVRIVLGNTEKHIVHIAGEEFTSTWNTSNKRRRATAELSTEPTGYSVMAANDAAAIRLRAIADRATAEHGWNAPE
jgi:hypothetical protein